MRPKGPKYSEYIDLKDEVLAELPENIDIEEIKISLKDILSKRRLGRIRNLSELLKNCEDNLLIHPEEGKVELFQRIVRLLRAQNCNNVSSSTWEKVEDLGPPVQPSQPRSSVTHITEDSLGLLISRLTAPGTGVDWEHFSLALGDGLPLSEDLRHRDGDIVRLAREHGDDIGTGRDILP